MSETSGVATKVLAIIRIVLPLLCSMKHVAENFNDLITKIIFHKTQIIMNLFF